MPKNYDDVLKGASNDTSDNSLDSEAAADEDLFIHKERTKKRRKLVRVLREYTGESAHGERKHKGWSDQGMMTFEKYVEEIRKDVEEDKYVAWEKAYRDVMEKLGHLKNADDNKLEQARYKPDLSIVYEGF